MPAPLQTNYQEADEEEEEEDLKIRDLEQVLENASRTIDRSNTGSQSLDRKKHAKEDDEAQEARDREI